MYPVMLQLQGKKIVVIGGGKIALRKVKQVLQAQGKVTVIAPEILPEFFQLLEVTLLKKRYQPEDIAQAQLIFACTDSKRINQQVTEDASAFQWVNNCGDHQQSDFYNMAVIEQEDHLLAVSHYGKNPTATKQLKKQLTQLIETTNLSGISE